MGQDQVSGGVSEKRGVRRNLILHFKDHVVEYEFLNKIRLNFLI